MNNSNHPSSSSGPSPASSTQVLSTSNTNSNSPTTGTPAAAPDRAALLAARASRTAQTAAIVASYNNMINLCSMTYDEAAAKLLFVRYDLIQLGYNPDEPPADFPTAGIKALFEWKEGLEYSMAVDKVVMESDIWARKDFEYDEGRGQEEERAEDEREEREREEMRDLEEFGKLIKEGAEFAESGEGVGGSRNEVKEKKEEA